jgi:hypothetical protein
MELLCPLFALALTSSFPWSPAHSIYLFLFFKCKRYLDGFVVTALVTVNPTRPYVQPYIHVLLEILAYFHPFPCFFMYSLFFYHIFILFLVKSSNISEYTKEVQGNVWYV